MSSIVFTPIYLPQNQGHGKARRISIDNTSNELVALMDSDDVSASSRFYKQLSLFMENGKLDVCGGHITEFVGEESNITGRREVCLRDSEIKDDLKKRCPMNQVTVMLKKKAYEKAGGYIDWYCEEDYYLWARMVLNNICFGNVDDDIVNVRTGAEMSSRRGGWKYFSSEKRMQKFLLNNGMISQLQYWKNILLRFGGEVILPNSLRSKLFKFVRKEYTPLVDEQEEKNVKKMADGFPGFSVAMCVYGKDNPAWFDRALQSVIVDQTVKPNEVVLVVDGPIPAEINGVIEKYRKICVES